MGTSITLVKKDWCVLSVEIDRHLVIEMSTGFVGSEQKATTSTQIKLDGAAELKSIIDNLQEIYEDLLKANICARCGQICHPTERFCECDWYEEHPLN